MTAKEKKEQERIKKEETIELALKIIKEASKNGVSNYSIAKGTKISEKTICNYVNGVTKPHSQYAEILIAYFNSNKSHTNKQYDEKEFEKSKPMIVDNEEDYRRLREAGVPLQPEVNFNFSAGNINIFNDKEFIKRYWYLPDCRDCEGVAQVSGTSMMPTYPPGCWVALKMVGVNLNEPNAIQFGNVFGIVIQDPITYEYHGYIKILRRYNDEETSKRKWIARSINISEFDDFDIIIEQVRGLWIVKQHIVSDIML